MTARVLVIEDNPANLELMTYLLRSFGHTSLQAVDGAEGLMVARRDLPELIVCDVQLPDVDGYEVAQQLKIDPRLKQIPLVAVTALAMVGDRRRILDAGFDGYIAKPINPESFISEVEAFLKPEQRSRRKLPTSQAPTSEPVRARGPAKGVTILVVDDLPANLDLVRSILEGSGYDVISAANVDEALTLTKKNRPALIISDVHMPGKSGFDLLATIKALPELSRAGWVFLASSPCTAKEQQDALTLGADRFIARPVEPEVLLREVEACLDEQRRNSGGDDPDC